jgi:hemin uptake protein HemP
MSASTTILLNERTVRKKLHSDPVLRQAVIAPESNASSFESPRKMVGDDVRYRVDELLQGGREAILVHRGQEYHLRITSTGKLILTK